MIARFILILLLVSASAARASTCDEKRPAAGQKATLHGGIQDDARGVVFKWRSDAQGGGEWEIGNAICNLGHTNLVVSWPKTFLFATAYKPLLPGKSLSNSFSVGGEPAPGASEIEYSYAGSKTHAQHYELKLATNSGRSLYSRIELFLDSSSSGPVAGSDIEQAVAYYFQATSKDDSYEFTFYPKTPQARFLWVGISSPQNNIFRQALAKIGVDAQIAPLSKFSKNVPQGWDDGLDKVEFVYAPPTKDYKPVTLTIPITPKRVDIARIVLLDSERNFVAAGRATLFGQ